MNDTVTTLLLISAPGLPLLLALPTLRRYLPWPLLLALLPAAALVLMPTPASVALPWFRADTTLGIDPASRWWLAMSLVVWASAYTLLPAIDRISGCTWLLLGLGGQLGAVLAADMVSFYSFATLMSYACVGLLLTERDPAGRRAGRRYLVLLIIGDLLLFEAMLLTATATERLSFATLAQAAAQSGSPPLYLALVVVGYLMKTGLWPLWWWLPGARRAPNPATPLLLWIGPMATGLLGMMRWLPLGKLAAPAPGTVLLVVGAAIAPYAVWSAWRQPATLLVCLTAAGVATTIGASLVEPALWGRVGDWLAPLVALAGTVLAITMVVIGDRAAAPAAASPKGSALTQGYDALVRRVLSVATQTLPGLRAAWFGYWQELWHQERWRQALTAAEQALRRWRLAVTLLLLLAIVMVALPLEAQP